MAGGPNQMTISDALKVLQVAPTADLQTVRASYRRLAFELHPDRNEGNAECAQRFNRVVRAYKLLRRRLCLDNGPRCNKSRTGECPSCGEYKLLLPALDGGHACSECLVLWRRRMLPAPPVVIASCVFSIAALIVALALLFLFLRTDLLVFGYVALAASLAAVLSTAITCFIVVEVDRPRKLRRRSRATW